MELVDGHQVGAVNILAKGSFASRLVGDERLEHGPHHVQLSRRGTDTPPRHLDVQSILRILFSLRGRIIMWFGASDPISARLPHRNDDAKEKINLISEG